MAARQLTSQNATITTASVQIKTLTVSGKQVTQAVFRQLREEPLITRDGYLNGTPWGYVNYHPDKCADSYRRHRHIVWQQDEDLLRSQVDDDPDFIKRDGSSRSFTAAAVDTLLKYRAYLWLVDGADATDLPRGLEHRYGPPADGSSFFQIDARPAYWTDRSIYVASNGSRMAADAVEKRLRKPLFTLPWEHEVPETRRAYELEQANQHEAEVSKTLDALRASLAKTGQALEQIEADYDAVITNEIARRQRHVDLLKSLADLPQLFIAV